MEMGLPGVGVPGRETGNSEERQVPQAAGQGRQEAGQAWNPVFPVPSTSIPSPVGSWYWSPGFKSHSSSDPLWASLFPSEEPGQRSGGDRGRHSCSFKPISVEGVAGCR